MSDRNADDVYFTNQIGKVAESETPVNLRKVTIVVYSNTTVSFIPSWGGVSYAGTPFNEETDILTPKGQTAPQVNEQSFEQTEEAVSSETADKPEETSDSAEENTGN